MIDLYFWTTDNGHKARQGLEESGLGLYHQIGQPFEQRTV